MWQAGLVDEVRRLEAQGLRDSRTASRALGYSQVLRLLAAEIDEDTARKETVTATRRFARRQDSWFRKDPRVRWVPYGDPALLAGALRGCFPDHAAW
jgi:tRNA dimethylallyltransferase